MSYETILYEKEEGVATITLNRPERLNALSVAMREDVVAALREADADKKVGTMILTGAGPCFSAGADVSAREAGPGRTRRTLQWWVAENLRRHRDGFFQIHDLSKPVIAAVHGYCLGWGFELAMSCDLIVAADDAEFGAPEIRHGSMLTSRLPFYVGMQQAKEILLTGDRIDAKEALRIGLVLHVVPKERLGDEVRKQACPSHLIFISSS